MVTTRRFIDYGDTRANAENNEKNSIVFLMVRNGQKYQTDLFPGGEPSWGVPVISL
uniref:hypothetical protein n=1 Tax=Escherichia coli TaxID=562 RepID=UPI001F2882F8|nr:hypothetical protein [Escherichia coli]